MTANRLPNRQDYDRYVHDNGWDVLEYTGADPDVSVACRHMIVLELYYGTRANPRWEAKLKDGPYKRIAQPLLAHCELLLQVNPDVDTLMKALAHFVSNLEPA